MKGASLASARQVYELQELDQALDALQAQLKTLDARRGDRSTLDAASKALEEQRTRLRDLQLKQRAQDGELASLQSRLHEIEGQLYGGSVTNPRDLEGLQREQGTLKERIAKMEEALLALMQSLEEAQAALTKAEAAAPGLEVSWRDEQQKVVQEAERLRGHMRSLVVKRAALAQALAPQEVSLYARLRATRGGAAVAVVERAVCGGCRVSLPTHMVQRARLGREMVFCPSCGRILLVN